MPVDRVKLETALRAVDSAAPETAETVVALCDSDEAFAMVGELIPELPEESRWAAVWIYASAGEDPEVLRPLLTDADAGIAARAAAGLAHRGDVAGLKALVSALSAQEYMRGSSPPLPVWTFAIQQLAWLTGNAELGPPLDADPAQVLIGAQRWRDWLVANEDNLAFAEGAWRW